MTVSCVFPLADWHGNHPSYPDIPRIKVKRAMGTPALGSCGKCILPYSDKRKQLLKMTFLVNEQNVYVTYIDINAISLYLGLNIFQKVEYFCSKLAMEVYVEYAKSNLKHPFLSFG